VKKTRFSKSQIVAILKGVELGAKVGETSSRHGVSEPTNYKSNDYQTTITKAPTSWFINKPCTRSCRFFEAMG
jgi:hypothetical protein